MLFHCEFSGRIKLNQVCQPTAESSRALSYVEDDFHLEIDEDIEYHQCVVPISQIKRNESRAEILQEDNGASTSRGRSQRLPDRYRQ